MRQAVILAAGRGVRLGNCGGDLPKCLLEVGGRSLLDLQIQALQDVGIHSICVVAGHCENLVRKATAGHSCVTVVSNPLYATTNSLYSLWLTADWVEDSFLCINGDLLAHPDVFHRLLAAEGCALAFDSGSGQEEEQMKVETDGHNLVRIGKNLGSEQVHGENLGILQFSAAGAGKLFVEAGRAIADGGQMSWAPSILNRFPPFLPVRCVDIRGLPWVEVDFPSDLAHAREVVWPAIQRHASSPLPAAASARP